MISFHTRQWIILNIVGVIFSGSKNGVRAGAACSAGRFGEDCAGICHCFHGNSICAMTTGRCLSGGCASGFTGSPNCQQGCSAGLYGPDCKLTCHCFHGNSVCDVTNGHCSSGGCARGFTGSPSCQQGCSAGLYGADCKLTCHCPASDTCDPVRGHCSSGSCLYGWDGPGCQLHLPVLTSPPNVTLALEDGMRVTWRSWAAIRDTGVPPIAAYTLEYQMESDQSIWYTAAQKTSQPDDDDVIYSHDVMSLSPAERYRFRVRLSGLDNGKLRPSIPGPVTEFIYTCQGAPVSPTGSTAQVQEVLADSVTISVSWDKPESGSGCSAVTSHQVRVLCVKTCVDHVTVIPMPDNQVKFSDIPFDGYMEIKVFAMSANGILSNQPEVVHLSTYVPEEGSPTQEQEVNAPETANASNNSTETELRNQGVAPSTLELATSSVLMIQVTSRTSDSISFVWAPGGIYINYRIAVTLSESYVTSVGLGTMQQVTVITEPHITITGLLDSSRYSIVVSGEYIDGTIAVGSLSVWTAPRTPAFPPSPSIADISSNGSIKLSMPIIHMDHSTPVSGLEVVVENLGAFTPLSIEGAEETGRRRRSPEFQDALYTLNTPPYYWEAELLNYTTAVKQGNAKYVAGVIPAVNLTTPSSFMVGDDTCSGGFCNPPLRYDMSYILWSCIVSTIDDLSRRSCVVVRDEALTSLTSLTSKQELAAQKKGASAAAIVVPIFLITVVAVIAAVIYIYFRRKRVQHKREVALADIVTYHLGPTLSDLVLRDKDAVPKQQTPTVPSRDSEPDAQRKHEFRQLPSGFMHTVEAGSLPQNKECNRSKRVLPFDRNRVQISDNGCGLDYVNASMVKVSAEQVYLVTQAPLPATRGAFWQTVWDYDVKRIVMLLPLKDARSDKVQYWKDSDVAAFGDLQVKVTEHTRLAFHSVRVFQVLKVGTTDVRRIYHYHYHGWEENGAPIHPIPFLNFITAATNHFDVSSMTLVHCLTGGGKSGLFTAVESILHDRKMKRSGTQVFNRVKCLRLERPLQVSQFAQYDFIYRCQEELTKYCAANIPLKDVKLKLESLVSQSTREGHSLLFKEYASLDANPPASPDDAGVLFVSPRPSVVGKSALTFKASYHDTEKISKVFSYQKFPGFLILSSPCTPQQATDIWSRVLEHKCPCIVFFGRTDETVQYWPNDGNQVTMGSHIISNNHTTCTYSTNTLCRDFLVEEGGRKHNVRQFQYLPWGHGTSLPPLSCFINFVRTVQTHAQELSSTNPVLVHCSDGSTRSALFACVWTLLERVRVENVVNIFQNVRLLRFILKDAIPNLDQYRFCYRAMKEVGKVKKPSKKTDNGTTGDVPKTNQRPVTSIPSSSMTSYPSSVDAGVESEDLDLALSESGSARSGGTFSGRSYENEAHCLETGHVIQNGARYSNSESSCMSTVSESLTSLSESQEPHVKPQPGGHRQKQSEQAGESHVRIAHTVYSTHGSTQIADDPMGLGSRGSASVTSTGSVSSDRKSNKRSNNTMYPVSTTSEQSM